MTQAELTEHFRRLIEYLERHEYLTWGLVGALFMGFMLLGSRASGWHKLATHYPCTNRYEGSWRKPLPLCVVATRRESWGKLWKGEGGAANRAAALTA